MPKRSEDSHRSWEESATVAEELVTLEEATWLAAVA